MEPQRDVGVLGRVRGRAPTLDLLEADALRALAGDLVVGERPAGRGGARRARPCRAARCSRARRTGAACRGRSRRAARRGSRARAGRTSGSAPSFCRDAILEPGLEQRQRPFDAELVGRAGVAVREREVRRLAGRSRTRRRRARRRTDRARWSRCRSDDDLGAARASHEPALARSASVDQRLVVARHVRGRRGHGRGGHRRARPAPALALLLHVLQPALEPEALEERGELLRGRARAARAPRP